MTEKTDKKVTIEDGLGHLRDARQALADLYAMNVERNDLLNVLPQVTNAIQQAEQYSRTPLA
jgi:hypothetical protein